MLLRLLQSVLFPLLLFFSSPLQARDAKIEEYIDAPQAKLAILDKITARVRTFTVPVGKITFHQRLRIDVIRCAETPPEFTPEALVYLTVSEILNKDQNITKPLFSGWMFASSPGLSAVEHPVYDIWLVDCLTQKELMQE